MAKSFSDLWTEFWKWNDAHPAGAFLFRGQADNKPIIPKIGRAEYNYGEVQERELFRAFQRSARPFVQIPISSDWEWLALAQHHGAPTRLADWTTSPLVAAWFAVTSYPLDTDAMLFGLDVDSPSIETFDVATQTTAHNATYADPLKVKSTVLLLETAPVTSRITTQRGIFTLHGDPTKALPIPSTDQFVIPKDLRLAFQGRLLDLGVDASHIYPDLDGLCKTLDWRLRSGKGFSAFA